MSENKNKLQEFPDHQLLLKINPTKYTDKYHRNTMYTTVKYLGDICDRNLHGAHTLNNK